MPGVPLDSVLLKGTRVGMLSSPLNHSIAPAMLVSETPSCVFASSSVR
jgi:hypothetical protein